jgi:predicted membrane metal-binding protein
MRFFFLLLLTFFFFTSCKDRVPSTWNYISLLKYDIPLNIQAPDDAEFKRTNFHILNDLTIISEKEDYYLQIFSSRAREVLMDKILNQKKLSVRKNPYFSRFIEESDNGFIFMRKIGDYENYDFRYVKLIGDREIVFQAPLFGKFDENTIRLMYMVAEKSN